MSSRPSAVPHRVLHLTLGVALTLLTLPAPAARCQELPHSGAFGLSFVYASDPTATQSQLFRIDPGASVAPIPVGAQVANVPSRWAHRRRTLGALETKIAGGLPLVLMTPMGSAVGDGAIHLVDYRTGDPPSTALVPTGNPAGYDLALFEGLRYVFSAEDSGAGTTLVRGFSWGAAGTLTTLSPATLSVPGAPSAYTNRMGVDEQAGRLWVPTASGVQELLVGAGVTQMSLGSFHDTTPFAPTTNPTRFDRDGTPTWIIGTSTFGAVPTDPETGGFLLWDASGLSESGDFGAVPSAPSKDWIPSAGAQELAVIGDGTDTYVYVLLREPKPGTFFIKGSAIGCVRLLGSAPADVGTIALSDEVGEPFANPSVSGTRLAFETSFGPPFVFEPADGGERVVLLYSPLDVLGAASDYGTIGLPAPLGGRISTKGMDRPLWSHDGSRVFATTSWFPGAPNAGVPGLEVLDVPPDVALNPFVGPHTVVPTPDFADQSIVFPSLYAPRVPSPTSVLFNGMSIVGHVAHDGLASVVAASFGELGQKQFETPKLVQNTAIPNFRAIFPAAFEDATASSIPVPDPIGARRTSFNVVPTFGFSGLYMLAADGDRILVQPTTYELLASIGLLPSVGSFAMALPSGWITTSEFYAL